MQSFCFKQKWNTLIPCNIIPCPSKTFFGGGPAWAEAGGQSTSRSQASSSGEGLFYRLSQNGCGQSDTPHSLESLLSDINIKWYLDTLGINTICEFTYIHTGMIQKIIFQCYRKRAPLMSSFCQAQVKARFVLHQHLVLLLVLQA